VEKLVKVFFCRQHNYQISKGKKILPPAAVVVLVFCATTVFVFLVVEVFLNFDLVLLELLSTQLKN